MKKNKKKEDPNPIGKWIIIAVITLVILTTILNILSPKKENDAEINISNGNLTGEKVNVFDIDMEKLRVMGERDRMEYYFSYWVELLESREYKEAYGILYPEFRETYFSRLSEFESYVKKTFPRMAGLTFINIERNGDIYVLWVEIRDPLHGSKDEVIEMNVVIKENDFANIEMSFSVV